MTLNRKFIAAGAAVPLLFATACAGGTDSEPGQEGPSPDTGSTAGADAGASYTLDEVAEQDSSESCWTVIEDGVYDVTEWISQHPGGSDRIEQLCGTDGTDAFTNQHEGATVPQSRLDGFRIGQVEAE